MWLRPYFKNYRIACNPLLDARQLLRGNIELEDGMDLHEAVHLKLTTSYQPILATERECLDLYSRQHSTNYLRGTIGGTIALPISDAERDKVLDWAKRLEPLYAKAIDAVDRGVTATSERDIDEILEVLSDADDWAMDQYCRVCEGDHAKSFSPF